MCIRMKDIFPCEQWKYLHQARLLSAWFKGISQRVRGRQIGKGMEHGSQRDQDLNFGSL